MDLKNYSTGVQHIGIPTNDIEKTIAFYQKLGFEIALQTVNEEADEKVAFLELETLVIETYENKAAKMESGAISMHNSLFRHFIDFPHKKAISFVYFFTKN